MQLHGEHGDKWAEISRIMGNKAPAQVRNRWLQLTNKRTAQPTIDPFDPHLDDPEAWNMDTLQNPDFAWTTEW
jgi:hypothetical protein